MANVSACPNCGSSNLFESREVSSGGGYAPDYLPGLSRFLSRARFKIVVCRDCGLSRWFAQKEALERIRDSDKWKRLL